MPLSHRRAGGWIVESENLEGQRFRPSDWIERISAVAARFGTDNRLLYSPDVRPCMIDGKKCLLLGEGLPQRAPDAYRHIMQFVHDNRLRISEHPARESA